MSLMICQKCDRWIDTDFHEMTRGGEVCIPCDEQNPRFAPRDPETMDPMGAQNHPLPPFKGDVS